MTDQPKLTVEERAKLVVEEYIHVEMYRTDEFERAEAGIAAAIRAAEDAVRDATVEKLRWAFCSCEIMPDDLQPCQGCRTVAQAIREGGVMAKAKCRSCGGPAEKQEDYCYGCRMIICPKCCVKGQHVSDGPHWIMPKEWRK